MKLIGDKSEFGIEYKITRKVGPWFNTYLTIWIKNKYIGWGEKIRWPLDYHLSELYRLTLLPPDNFREGFEMIPENFLRFSGPPYSDFRERYMFFNGGGYDDWETYNFTIKNELCFLWKMCKGYQFSDRKYGFDFKFEKINHNVYNAVIYEFLEDLDRGIPEFMKSFRTYGIPNIESHSSWFQ